MPPKIKIYEALGSLADGRVELFQDGSVVTAKVTSSEGNKSYTVKYDESAQKITSNDNASKWQGYTGYPILAVLMKLRKLPFDEHLSQQLAGIEWKKINSKFKNDWAKTEAHIFVDKDRQKFEVFADILLEHLTALGLER